jgi:serine/threonine protein kinase
MPPPKNGPEFLDLVRKSGLLEPKRIEGYVGSLQQEGPIEGDASRLASRLIKDGIVTVFQARQMLRGRYKGFFLGKYKVLEPIGSGGMADIYLCEHTTMRHKVAVKILPLEKLKDPSLLGRFRREAQAIATLNHPNIVRAYDLDHEGNLHYMVTEYIDGSDLQELVKRNGPLVPERAANYIAQAAAGLQHLHEAGLVHRDIKPGNLLLDRTGAVKLLDLGLARFSDIERQDNLTREYDDGRVLGTADYIAPEQSIKGSEVDIRADIYSLGGSFYFLLKGEAPFEGTSVTQKLLFHQIKDPPPLPAFVPKDIIALLKKMMMKKADERPQTPADVVTALLRYLEQAFPPVESELPPRASIFSSGPKTSTPRSSGRISGRITPVLGATALSAKATDSQRVKTPSAGDIALRSTPVSGVNVGTKPIRSAAVTIPEVVEDDEPENEVAGRPAFTMQGSSYLSKHKWLILGCILAILLLVAAIVMVFLVFAKSEKPVNDASVRPVAAPIASEFHFRS